MEAPHQHCRFGHEFRLPERAPDDDFALNFEEDEDEDDDSDDDSHHPDSDDGKHSLASEKAFRKFLPELKLLVEQLCGTEKPNLVTDRAEKCCPVCPTPQRFKGWKALLAHAGQFKKKRVQQHRGYHRALQEALRLDEKSREDENVRETRAVSIKNPDVHLIVWPPVLIIQSSTSSGSDLFHRAKAFLAEEFRHLHNTRCLQVSRKCSFVVFMAEAVGYLEAQMVAKWFADRRRGREDIDRRSSRHEEREPPLYGYLATPDDMRHWDPERKVMQNWTKESYHEKVQIAQRKFKQDHDKEQAMLKAMELQVENLAEDELKFKTKKEHIERLIGEKQKEIESHKRRAEEMERNYQDAVHRLHEAFRNDMRIFEARSTSRVKRLREELEQNEKRLEEERAIRTKDIENLQKQFRVLTKSHKEKETQKALERELEVMQKKQDWKADMAKTEAMFNRTVRERESNLQDKQHQEMMLLVEEAKREREKLLKEWLEKSETLKKEKLEAKKAKEQSEETAAEDAEEQVSECAICMDPLNEKNRALLVPCGHARLCLSCAKDVQKEKGICPFCRKKIKKAMLLPKLFM